MPDCPIIWRRRETTWERCHDQTSRREISGSWSTHCTGCTTRPGGQACARCAREVGCSPTTVSTVFSSPRLPTWGVLELLVESMGGDVAQFHRLWMAASNRSEVGGTSGPPIAGRRAELPAIRRHLETGTGLLLITGEAGIGKTRLVTTAASLASTSTFVAAGSCLPLSSEVPLLPIADVLEEAFEVDDGQWVKEALADCPPYVTASLRRLLPALDQNLDVPVEPDDAWSRQRLFTAVGAVLTVLGDLRPLAVLVEDLHWADSATLDLLEHLLTRGRAGSLVGTWRSDDHTTPEAVVDWLTRVRRLPSVSELPIGPLDRDETTEQLDLLGVGPFTAGEVDSIFRRSLGHPLFTEQLAAQGGARARPARAVGRPARPPTRRPRRIRLVHRPRPRGRGPAVDRPAPRNSDRAVSPRSGCRSPRA